VRDRGPLQPDFDEGLFTLDLEANVIQKQKAQDWEWGAMAAYSTGTWNLSKGSVDINSFRLGIAGRMRL